MNNAKRVGSGGDNGLKSRIHAQMQLYKSL